MTTVGSVQFDEIGHWSELKLEIVEKYGAAYTTALSNARNLKKIYIDGYSGAGVHVSRRTGVQVEGSPARALKVSPPFDGFYFIDMDASRTAHLKTLCRDRSDVVILTGDANVELTKEVLPKIHFRKFNRALCLLDPYGLHLDWEVMQLAGQSQAVDMFLNFPVMDMNRNAIWKYPAGVPQDGVERMTRFWGDESWKKVADNLPLHRRHHSHRPRGRVCHGAAGRSLRGRPRCGGRVSCCAGACAIGLLATASCRSI